MVCPPVFLHERIKGLGVVILDVYETGLDFSDDPLGVFFKDTAVERHDKERSYIELAIY